MNNPTLSFSNRDKLLISSTITRNEKSIFVDKESDEAKDFFNNNHFVNFKCHEENGISETNGFSIEDSILIKGDNLRAMNELLKTHKGRVKAMYWDILYNTNNKGLSYNDCFSHSDWLVMMKNRLEVAKELLKNDGVICLQCDDNEMHYLKVLCDEIFGRDNFRNCIVVEMASSGGLKRSNKNKRCLKTKEYILVYAKSEFKEMNELLYDNWTHYDANYDIIFDANGIQSLKDKVKMKFKKYGKVNIEEYLNYQDIKEFLINNSEVIFRRHDASSWAIKNVDNGVVLWEDLERETRNKVVKSFNPKNNEDYELLMRIKKKKGGYGWERLEPLNWNVVNGELKKLRGDLWCGFHKDMGNVKNEGSVKLSGGKKPERLIADILKAFTREGDIVLDAFLGAGTTSAVAHKMNRKFIGIEALEENYQKAKDRMDGVLSGENTGISKAVGWQGGGSFISCELNT